MTQEIREQCLICESLHEQRVMSHDEWSIYSNVDNNGHPKILGQVAGWLCPNCSVDPKTDDKIHDYLWDQYND